jgi:hypothetical protein
VAGAAGIQIGWAIIAPGDRTRAQAVAEAGRRSVVIVLGLVLAFITAGTIEGFITGYTSTAIRVTVGIVVEAAFVLYVVRFGRRAAALGQTGLLGERKPTWGDLQTADGLHPEIGVGQLGGEAAGGGVDDGRAEAA